MATYLKTPLIISNLKLRGIDIYNLTPEQYRKLSTISVLSPTVASLTQYHGDGQNYINLIDALQGGNAGKINFTDLEKMLDSRFGRLSNEPSKPKLGEENNPITLPEITVLPLAEVNWADINNNLVPQKTLPYDPLKWFYEGIEWMKNNPLQAAKQAASFIPGIGEVIDGYDIYTDLKDLNYAEAAIGLGAMFLPEFVEKGVKKGIKKVYNYFNSPYGLRFGNFAYSPDRSVLTSGFPKLNATKVGNATPEELRLLEQIRSQFSKLPSQDEVLLTIRDTASKNGITMAETDDGRSIVFRLDKQEVETSPGVREFIGSPENAYITVTNSIHWPKFLDDAGINAPVVTQFDMIPEKGKTLSRKNSMSMARIDNALPSGTIIAATPEILLHKDIMRLAVVHSNLSPEEKVMLFRKIDSDNTSYLPDDGNLSADSYNMILKKSLQKTNKGLDTYRLFGGQEIEVLNNLSLDPNNPLKMFIEPRLGKNFRAGQVLDYNIKDGFGKYVKENYPALLYSDDSVEAPLIYLQKRRFGGKLNKRFK